MAGEWCFTGDGDSTFSTHRYKCIICISVVVALSCVFMRRFCSVASRSLNFLEMSTTSLRAQRVTPLWAQGQRRNLWSLRS